MTDPLNGRWHRRDVPEPCTEEARDEGRTCRIPAAGSHDIDPPEPRRNPYCELHGWRRDPDDERDRRRDDRLTEGGRHD